MDDLPLHYVIILNNASGVIFKPIPFVVSFKNIVASSITWKSKVDTIYLIYEPYTLSRKYCGVVFSHFSLKEALNSYCIYNQKDPIYSRNLNAEV